MKLRNRFVANSSSSSFIIATKEKLNKEKLVEALKVPKESLMYGCAVELADALMDVREITIEKYLDESGYNTESDIPDHLKHILTMNIYQGYASDEANQGEMENILCYMIIEYISDDLIIIKEYGGY